MSTNKKVLVEVVYGAHPVMELLKQKKRKVYEIYTLKTEPKILNSIKSLMPSYPVKVHAFSRQALTDKLGTSDHQGIAAVAQPYPFRKQFFDAAKEPFLLLLDGVQDVRNMGALIRTAYCAGVNGIILTSRGCAPLNAVACKTAAGLTERVSIYNAPSTAAALQLLKEAGYQLYVAALSSKANAYTITYKQPLCLVVGSEGTGVSKESLKAGTIVTLPQVADDVSYNVSVATGMLLGAIAHKIKN